MSNFSLNQKEFSYSWSKLLLLKFKWIFCILFLAVRSSNILENEGNTKHYYSPFLKYVKDTLNSNYFPPDFSHSSHHGVIANLIRDIECRKLSKLFKKICSSEKLHKNKLLGLYFLSCSLHITEKMSPHLTTGHETNHRVISFASSVSRF